MRKRRLFLSEIEILESRRLLANLSGLDVSGYQYDLNWTDVKADGYTFAYEKATQGNYYTDPYYNYNITQAKAVGIPIGSYDFADFTVNPTTEANYFWSEVKSTISGDGLTLQPMLDAEKYQTGNEDSWIATWTSAIIADGKAAGYTLQPIIYTYTSWAASYVTTATSKAFPLWIASSSTPNNSSTAPWTSYEIWQTTASTASIPTTDGEGSVKGDADQLNGDATELKNLIVTEGKYAINSNVVTTASVTAYQNSNSTGTSSNVATNVTGTVLSLPVYYNNAWMFDVQFTTGVTGWVTETKLAVPAVPSTPTTTAPANNATITTIPTFTWNTDAGATSYNLFVNNASYATNLTGTSYTPTSFAAGSYTWYIQAKNSVGTTNSATAMFTYVLPVPVASYSSQVPTTGASVLDFAVGYSDPSASINTSTFDSNDITVTGPNGYSQAAVFMSQSQPGNGPSRSATYEISAPNGVWNILANGTYTVTLNANQVADTNGTYVAGGTLGTFVVSAPFAYINSSSQLIFNATTAYPNISFSKSGSLWSASNGNANIQFNPIGYTSLDFIGTSGNDSLTIYSATTLPLSFNGGTGQDSLTLYAGSLSFASDLGATNSALTLNTYNSAIVNFYASQHLAGLDLYSTSSVVLAAGAGIAVETQDLEINNSAYVDVADNALVVYGSDSDTMTSYLASGSNSGAWNGIGINSSVAATSLGRTVGFAPASSLSYSSINGVSFSTAAIVVRYTYDGDANLDGTVNSDDLSLVALAAAQQQTAQANNQPAPTVYYYNGDFNYDTTVNSDDFLLLSLGSAVQNQQTLA